MAMLDKYNTWIRGSLTTTPGQGMCRMRMAGSGEGNAQSLPVSMRSDGGVGSERRRSSVGVSSCACIL